MIQRLWLGPNHLYEFFAGIRETLAQKILSGDKGVENYFDLPQQN